MKGSTLWFFFRSGHGGGWGRGSCRNAYVSYICWGEIKQSQFFLRVLVGRSYDVFLNTFCWWKKSCTTWDVWDKLPTSTGQAPDFWTINSISPLVKKKGGGICRKFFFSNANESWKSWPDRWNLDLTLIGWSACKVGSFPSNTWWLVVHLGLFPFFLSKYDTVYSTYDQMLETGGFQILFCSPKKTFLFRPHPLSGASFCC